MMSAPVVSNTLTSAQASPVNSATNGEATNSTTTASADSKAATATAPSATGKHELDAEFAKYRPLVVCGPSGVGKGTLLREIRSIFPHHFHKVVSYTTRKPRQVASGNGQVAVEQHGIDYNFVEREW